MITSFPKELTAAYKKAYEAKFPNDKLEILNKNTAAGIAYVREQAAGSRPEVFWASAFQMNARLADRYRDGRVFLAGDASGYMTGQAINVTGGQEMK